MLTNLLFVDDIDAFLSGNYSDIQLTEPLAQHAMTGYKWFQIFNAWIFGLDARVEIWCYFLIMFALCMLVGVRYYRSTQGHKRGFSAFVFPIVLLSLVGAGSRGMELGTFFGVAVFLFWVDAIDKNISTRLFSFAAVPVSFALVFLFLGGYGIPLLMSTAFLFIFRARYGGFNEHQRKRTLALLVPMAAATASYSVLFMISGSGNGSDSSSLLELIRQDTFFPIKFIIGGQSGALITNQSLENLTPSTGELIALVLGVGTMLLAILGLVLSRSNAVGTPSLGVFLSVYGLAMALFLLPFRNSSEYQLLNGWYSFHLKVSFAGSLLLWMSHAVSKPSTRSARGKWGAVVTLTLLTLLQANLRQWERQPHERKYFSELAELSRFPSLLTVNSDGLTELRLPRPATLSALGVLREHKLGVFRSGSAKADEPLVAKGAIYDDGWAGPSFALLVRNQACTAVVFSLRAAAPIKENTVIVRFGDEVIGPTAFDTKSTEIIVPLRPTVDVISLEFSESVIPRAIGLSPDERPLSALADYRCRR